MAAACTTPVWPVNCFSAVPAGNAQVRTTPSAPAVTRCLPSALGVAPRIAAGWAIDLAGFAGYAQERNTLSAPTVTKLLPLALTAIPVTAPAWAVNTPDGFPSAVHRNTFPSAVPAATAALFGQRAVVVTPAVTPVNSRVSCPFATFDSLTALSDPPIRALLPSAESVSDVMASECAGRAFGTGTGNCQNFSSPSAPTV